MADQTGGGAFEGTPVPGGPLEVICDQQVYIAELLASRERLQGVVQRLVEGWGDAETLWRWAFANAYSKRAEIAAIAAHWGALEQGDLMPFVDTRGQMRLRMKEVVCG